MSGGADVQFHPADLATGADVAAAIDVMRPSAGVSMYAHDNTQLFVVSPPNFDLTTIGPFGINDDMTDLAVTPDGSVYTISNTTLYRVDPQTAAATLVTTLGTGAQSNVALTFLPDGTLLAGDKAAWSARWTPAMAASRRSARSAMAWPPPAIWWPSPTVRCLDLDAGSADAETNNIPSRSMRRPAWPRASGRWVPARSGEWPITVATFTRSRRWAGLIDDRPHHRCRWLKRTHPVDFSGAGVTPLL